MKPLDDLPDFWGRRFWTVVCPITPGGEVTQRFRGGASSRRSTVAVLLLPENTPAVQLNTHLRFSRGPGLEPRPDLKKLSIPTLSPPLCLYLLGVVARLGGGWRPAAFRNPPGAFGSIPQGLWSLWTPQVEPDPDDLTRGA